MIDGPDTQDGHTWSGFVRARIKGPLGLDQELRVDGMELDRVSVAAFGGQLFPFEARGRRLDLRWTASAKPFEGISALVGVERETSKADTGSGFESARNWGAFAVVRAELGDRASATVSVRRDEPRDFRGVTTARVSGALRLAAGFSAEGDFGQGFKAPSIFERTYPCLECIPPRAAVGLRPEHAQGWDAGLSWRSPGGRLTARARAYGLSVRDQIDYIFPQGYVNLERTRTRGIEAEAHADLAHGLWLEAAYAYADSRDEGTGARLLRVPLNSGSATAGWSSGRVELSASLRAQGPAADVFGTIRPFAVVDVAGAWRVRPGVQLTARIENLFNTRYQQAFGYGEPGFGAFVGVRLRGP